MKIGGETLPDRIDLYEILELNPSGLAKTRSTDRSTATAYEIKKAYNKLALRYHPDRPDGDPAKFILINRAYTILSDPNLRKEYDLIYHRYALDDRGDRGDRCDRGDRSDRRARTTPKNPLNPFIEMFSSPKIIEELRWINDIINSSYHLYQQLKEKRANRFEPIIPIPGSDHNNTEIRTRTGPELGILMEQLFKKDRIVSTVATVGSTVDSAENMVGSGGDAGDAGDLGDPVPLEPTLYEIEVTGTIRQYLQKRKKKIKIRLPSGTEKIVHLGLNIREHLILVEETGERVAIKVKILNEPVNLTSDRRVNKNERKSERENEGDNEGEDEGESAGRWSIHPNRIANTENQNHKKRDCLIYMHRDPATLNEFRAIGPTDIPYLFKIDAVSPINIYYSDKNRETKAVTELDFIVYLVHERPEKPEVPGRREVAGTQDKTVEILLYPFNTIEELLSY